MGELLSSVASYTFLQNAIIAGILASIVCGITGTFVVVKKITFISGGIAHAVLGGVGIAFYFSMPPIIGAFVSAILSAIIIGLVKLKANQHEDTVISALWAMGMAVGVIFMYLTPGYSTDLLSYLFGNILMVSSTNLYILAGLNVFIIFIVIIFYRQFVAITYDEEQARLRGLPVNFLYILLLCIIALTIVVLIQIVGIILVIDTSESTCRNCRFIHENPSCNDVFCDWAGHDFYIKWYSNFLSATFRPVRPSS